MFPHWNIRMYTWTFPDRKTHNDIDYILIEEEGCGGMNWIELAQDRRRWYCLSSQSQGMIEMSATSINRHV